MTATVSVPVRVQSSKEQQARAARLRAARDALAPYAEPKRSRVAPGTRPARAVPDQKTIEVCLEIIAAIPEAQAYDQLLDRGPGFLCQCRVTTALLGIALVVWMGLAKLELTSVLAVLHSLPEDYQKRFGVLSSTGHRLTYRQLTYRLEGFREILDPKAKRGRRRERRRNGEASKDDEIFTWFGNLIITRHLELNGVEPANVTEAALDASTVDTPSGVRVDESLPEGTDRRTTKDPEAGPAHRPAKNGQRSGTSMGYDLHFLTQTQGDGLDGKRRPGVIAAYQLEYPNKGGRAYLELLDLAAEHGVKPIRVRGDKGISALKNDYLGGNFHEGLAERGVQMVHPLREWRGAPAPSYRGMVWVDSNTACPFSPQAQVDLPMHKTGTPKEQAMELCDRYDHRSQFFFVERQRQGVKGGGCRLECPARRGKVRCPLVPKSMRLPADQYDTAQPPENMRTRRQIAEIAAIDPEAASKLIPAPDCCEQETITLPASIEPGRYQAIPIGTTQWYTVYHQREHVESAYAGLKENFYSLRRGSYRYFGRAMPTLFLAFMIVRVNQGILDSFDERHETGG
jgi:hypothetical protein